MNKKVNKEKNVGVVTKDTPGIGKAAEAITDNLKDKRRCEHQLELDRQYDENGKLIPYVVKSIMNKIK